MWIATWLMLADPTVLTVERVHFANETREKMRARRNRSMQHRSDP